MQVVLHQFFFFVIAAACVSMYQAGGVVGTILIGYLSDLLIKQVCSTDGFIFFCNIKSKLYAIVLEWCRTI